MGLALVESGGRVPAHFRVLPPLGQEDGPIDASDVAQRERQSVLTRECGQLRQQGRGPDLAGTDSRDQSQDVIPVCLDPLDVDGLADERCQVFRWRVAGEEIQLAILETAQARHKLETDEVAEGETHIADPAGIDIVGFDSEIAAVIEQTVEDVYGLARIRVHGDDVERPILVGGEAIEFGAWIGAIAGIEVADRLGVPSRRKILPIRGRGGSVAPQPCQRQLPLGIDEDCMRRGVAFFPDMPVVCPGELAHRQSGRNIRHSREAEIDAVRQNGGKKRKLVVGPPPGAQMCEDVGKSRSSVHLKQQVGNADRRQAAFHLRFQRLRDVRKHGLVWRDAETRAGQFDIVELTGFRQMGKVAQSVVQGLALLLQIGFHISIDSDRKRAFLAHQLERRRRNEEALEGLEALGSLHPDIAGIETALQFAEQAEFIGPTIDLAILQDERHPASRRKGYGSPVGYRSFPFAVQIGDHG